MPTHPTGGGVRYPSTRAFVVQLADAGAFQGRVEHLTSGEVGYFDSVPRLAEFIRRILDVRADGDEPFPTPRR